ncbi:MAG: hypothetical protein ABR950_03020 [Candidatus Dormibacteria bacterium]
MRPLTSPAPANLGPMWTRLDYYALSVVTALVVLVIGVVIGVTDATSTTVQAKPAATTSSFTVASGDGKTLLCGSNIAIDVAGTQAHVAAVNGDRVTLAAPLRSAPASGATVSQSMVTPGTVDVCAAVAASPAPTTTQFTLAGGAGIDFVAAGISIDGRPATIKSVNTTSYRITLSNPLASAPAAGTPVTQELYTTGSLIGGIVGLAISEISIVVLAVAALVARPMAGRLRRRERPKVVEVLVFGALVAVIDTLVYYLEVSTLGSTTGTGVAVAELTAAASGFVIVPLIFPPVARWFRRPRREPRLPRGQTGR